MQNKRENNIRYSVQYKKYYEIWISRTVQNDVVIRESS